MIRFVVTLIFVSTVLLRAQSPADLYQKGQLALQHRQPDSALVFFSMVLKADSLSVPALISRAQTNLQLAHNAEAYEDATRALRIDSTLHAAWYVRGVSLSKLGRHELAASDYRAAIRINPSFAPAWMNLGMVLMESGNPIQTCTAWKKFLELAPNDKQAPEVRRYIKEMSQDSLGIQDSVFTNDSGTVSIRLPRSWYTNCTDDGKTLNFFVSLEPIKDSTDMFTVGCTINHIRRMSRTFDLKGNTDGPFLAALWEQTLDSAYSLSHKLEYVSKKKIRHQNWVGTITEIKRQQTPKTYKLSMFRVILAREDEVFVAVLEAPVEHWGAYKDRFLDAITSMNIKLP